ncbi:MAG: DegT/DnrJ/EryC1/StrS family aminotransferase [Candidatus Sumerlaeia bacterium]|nr:DegT/DnrJ/EryC1/StrS family aminotransferase [Candidatus Sumerlaeia bacterium]
MSAWEFPLTETTLGEEEREAALRVLDRKWLSMGPEVEAFEQEFAAATGAPHAVAVSNGTAALELAYQAVGLRCGDRIALPALTFVAALNAALRLGLEPVLLDIESPLDLTPSNAALERALARAPGLRAVVSMPYGGWAPRMAELADLRRAHGLALVEDSCHAVLATLGGRSLGTFGDAGTFSFFPNKNMTTGEGGMVATPRADVAERLRRLRSHGMTTMTWDRERGHAHSYDVVAAGTNARMDEIRAAIGRAQLAKLPAANASRRESAAWLARGLSARTGGALAFPFHEGPPRPADETPSAHLLVALLPEGHDRARFREALAERRVQSSMHYPPLYTFTHARELLAAEAAHCPVLESVRARLVTLPLAPGWTEQRRERLAELVADAFTASAR